MHSSSICCLLPLFVVLIQSTPSVGSPVNTTTDYAVYEVVSPRNESASNDSISSMPGGPDNVTLTTKTTNSACRLVTADRFMHRTLSQLLNVERATLIEYRLSFANYSDNPLSSLDVVDDEDDDDDNNDVNDGIIYGADRWSRVTTAHGQTLLSLAFNYGVLSMMTLTFGTEMMHVELADSPPGCLGSSDVSARLSRRARIELVRDLLMRDLDADGPLKAIGEARVCHEILVNETGYARFRHRCCYVNSISGLVECSIDVGNIWLRLLYGLLFVVRLVLLLYGPYLFARIVERMAVNNIPYVVKLKDPLDMTAIFCTSDTKLADNVRCRRTLDLRPMKGMPKLKDIVARGCVNDETGLRDAVPIGQPVRVRFDQYDISVDYKRMLTENSIEVGVMQSLFRAIFKCQIRNVGPFQQCCKSDMLCSSTTGNDCCCCRRTASSTVVPWIRGCQLLAGILLVILVIPFPYYVRLALFYGFEYDELRRRKQAIAEHGLVESYENSLIHYLLPTHGLFIAIYVVYVLMAVALAATSRSSGKGNNRNQIKKVLVGSFHDLRRLAWTDTLSMAVANVIWPFKRFGCLGLLVGIIYWPIAIPLTVVICIVYSLPTVYLTVRMAYSSKSAIFEKARRRKKNRPYQVIRILLKESV